MKTAEIKSSSSASNLIQAKRQSFFSKEGQDSFFSKSHEATSSFFSPVTIQPKLTVGQPNDKYEVEADAMADKVVQRLSNNTSDSPLEADTKRSLSGGQGVVFAKYGSSIVQTKCSECEQEEKLQKKEEPLLNGITKIQRKPIFESNAEQPEAEVQTKLSDNNYSPFEGGKGDVLQAKCTSCQEEEKLQKKEEEELADSEMPLQRKSADIPSENTSDLESRLSSSKGSGSSLPSGIQTAMGSEFGADFSNVRIHTGTQAVQMSQDIGAQAFTHGNDIYFNQGKYDTNSSSGKHLLVHELTHTVQQGASTSGMQPKKMIQRAPLNSPNLSQLREYLSDDDESEAISLMGNLTPDEKETVLNNREFKELAIDAFWNSEMFEAIQAMHHNLYKSLEWMFDEGTDYESVKSILRLIGSGKETVRNDGWMKEQFVSLCDNDEMAEAVDLLSGTLLWKLSWMYAEGSDWELMKAKIVATTDQQQKLDIYPNTEMKEFFMSELGNEEMAEAVGLLGGTLLQKLSWMYAEGSDWELIKAKIIGTADTTEKTALYGNSEMKEFFVDECDNDTMFEAVKLLGGLLIQKLTWMLEEGTENEYLIEIILSAPKSELAAVQANADIVAQLNEYLNYEREVNSVDTNIDLVRQMLERKSVCGPNITSELNGSVATAAAMFGSWNDAEKNDRCFSLISIETGGIAWDIDQLFNQNHGWILGYRPDCATAQNHSSSTRADELCGNTVQVKDQCFYAGSPNYIIFGKMMKLCFDHYDANNEVAYYDDDGNPHYKKDNYDSGSTLDLVWLYKSGSTNYEASKAFTEKGYDSTATVPQGDRPGCNPLCSTPYTGPTFTVRWSSFATDREAGRENLRDLNR